jgi:ribosomal protein S18 acetylase RimI-like enzyme
MEAMIGENKVKIKEADQMDAKAIARVQVDSYLDAYKTLLPAEYLANFTYEEQERDWLNWGVSHPDDILLVAEDASKVIGYSLSRELTDEPGWGEVAALHVSPEQKQKGAGKMLFVESARRLKQKGCRSLLIWTLEENPSRGFYEHLGGVLNDSRDWIIEELEFNKKEVCYRWMDILNIH